MQVAHDYQSPLASLKAVIQGLKSLSIEQRLLLNTSVSRIEWLSNDLMIRYKDKEEINNSYFTFASAALEAVFAEKMATIDAHHQIEFSHEISSEALVAGVAISQNNLSRVFSNLINNAADAVKDSSRALIKVTMLVVETNLIIDIEDNGMGMTSDILNKVRTIGGTYAKANGSGLGISHAKGVLAKAGGKLCIDSVVGSGTRLSLTIPIASPPGWCSQVITLREDENIVILDDDESMHQLWKKRLTNFDIEFLKNPEEFEIKRYNLNNTRFIFDYDIIGSSVTGLDLIKVHELGAKSLLVTSYFNDAKIQKAIQDNHSKMLAKFMVSRVKIELLPRKLKPKNGVVWDMVLIDDDQLMHKMWDLCASEVNKNLLILPDLNDFYLYHINYNTPIYIDKKLGVNLDGFDVAKKLNEEGYRELYITTGYEAEMLEKPAFIKSILGKKFPVSAQN